MEDTNIKLTLDLGQRALQQFSKFPHQLSITIDLSPNTVTAIKYVIGSLIIYKSIDVSIYPPPSKKGNYVILTSTLLDSPLRKSLLPATKTTEKKKKKIKSR